MKRLLAVILLISCASFANAQEETTEKVKKQEFAVLGGYYITEGAAMSFNYYYPVTSLLLGPVVDVAFVEGPAGANTTIVAPGANICLKFRIPYGHFYGGLTGRARFGSSYIGTEFGLIAGTAIFFTEHLGANFETGIRPYTASEDTPLGTLSVNSVNIPVMIGLRYQF